jgi:hypothetical protein
MVFGLYAMKGKINNKWPPRMKVKVKKRIIDHDCLKIYTYNFWGSKDCLKNMPHQTKKNIKIKTFTIHLYSMP